jgi:carboxymethylenebutenolidase
MRQEIIDLFDHYTHESMPRELFLKKLAKLTGGALAATSVLSLLETNYALAATIAESTSDLNTGYIEYQGVSGKIRAYMASPLTKNIKPSVLVIHENRGLNPHIEDVTRRVAKAGFYTIAPDALSPVGGTPDDSDKAREMIRELDKEKTLGDYLAGVDYLKNLPVTTDMVGCVGFCWGGGMANQLAVHSNNMRAAVAFYGRQPAVEDVPRIWGSLLLHYAGLDKRINAGIPDFESALRRNLKDYQLYMYDSVNHAFHNDTSKARYNEEAATLAWQRTIDFLNEKLK